MAAFGWFFTAGMPQSLSWWRPGQCVAATATQMAPNQVVATGAESPGDIIRGFSREKHVHHLARLAQRWTARNEAGSARIRQPHKSPKLWPCLFTAKPVEAEDTRHIKGGNRTKI
jgi:hypothetical protein